MIPEFRDKIFNIKDESGFRDLALKVYDYQINKNIIYQSFITNLGKNRADCKSITVIPFLPIEFFRNHKIVTGDFPVEIIFESSGTAGFVPARHFVNDSGLYEESFLRAFRLFYGDPEEYLIAALLPSYTERRGSSLVYMASDLIKRSHNSLSGFYRDDVDDLIKAIEKSKEDKRKVLLLGVSYALLDMAERLSPDLSDVIIMETGGMKGRRKELTRSELHGYLKEKFRVTEIHSEYGMTELMSQAYSKGEGIFYCPPWMRVLIRDPQDPLTVYTEPGKTGGINIIDLANVNSCSFIATGDLGRVYEDGAFEVLGRFDNSDIRGCNLLVE